MPFRLRPAVSGDVPALTALINDSVRRLQADDYTASQIECALATVYGADSQLIEDGTYYVVEAGSTIVGCGGWSKRRTLYGGDQCTMVREDALLDPGTDAAKIRAFFVHPDWVRQGIGTLILQTCEEHAVASGFSRLEMGSTLTGVPLYRAKGYMEVENLRVPLANGDALPIVRMEKRITSREISSTR